MPYSRVIGLSRPYIRRVAARFAGKVERLRNGRLHGGGDLEVGDPRFELGIARIALAVGAVQLFEEAKLVVAGLGRDAGGRLQIEHRRVARSERRSLIDGRQPAARPVANAVDRQTARVRQDHVGRQVLVLGSERVDNPRAPGRPPGQDLAGVDQAQGRLVIDRLGGHRAHQRQVVDDPRQMRNKLAEDHSRLAMRLKPKRRGQQLARLLVEVNLELARIGLALMLRERGLGVKQIHLARPAMLEQADHRPGSCSAIGNDAGTDLRPTGFFEIAATGLLLLEQMSQGQRPDGPRVSAQESAAIQGKETSIHRAVWSPL